MKVAVWHNLPSGGGKRALYYHVRGLVERGHEVEVWCPSTADRDFLPLNELAREHVVPLAWHPVGMAGRAARRFAPAAFFASRLREVERHCRQCAAEIAAGGFDVLFANTCMYTAAPPIGRFLEGPSLPRVLYLQEPRRDLYEARPYLPWMAPTTPARQCIARLQAGEERRNVNAYDLVLANSLFSRESMLRAYGCDARVCYLGVDTERFADRGQPRQNMVVGVGEWANWKNVRFVIDALAEVPSHARPLLSWVGNRGDAGYRDEMVRHAAARCVPFEPRTGVSDESLVDLLNQARLMVYAPRLEPFGFAPLEANACGVPVVAVAEGGVRETIQHGVNGLLVESEPRAMAEAINQLLDDPRSLERMRGEARRVVCEQWSLAASVERLERRLVQAAAMPRPDAVSQDGRAASARVSARVPA